MSSIQLTGPEELEVFEMLVSVVRTLVDNPKDVEVVPIASPTMLTFQVRTNPAVIGNVVGKHGRVARALRVILGSNAARLGRNLSLDIVAADGSRLGNEG